MDGSRLYEQTICLGNVLQLTISLAQVSIRDFGYFDLICVYNSKQQNIPMNSISGGPFTRKRDLPFLPVHTGLIPRLLAQLVVWRKVAAKKIFYTDFLN